MKCYYNEIDPYAAQWLYNLIEAGHIASGDVDERSIVDVCANDLKGYRQCHFFAGIGGWSLALRLAGWSDERECWTGSCPCQPLSSAGQRRGHADQRHLWPAFHRLIAECRPAIVFGEQVASKDGLEWLAAVRADLEASGYACGAADLPAAGVGAPHIRQRLWFAAAANGRDAGAKGLQRGGQHGQQPQDGWPGELADAESQHDGGGGARSGRRDESANSSYAGELDDTAGPRHFPARQGTEGEAWDHARMRLSGNGRFWSDCDWLPCHDGKARPVEPGILPLAHGISARVGKLRAAGNAIVPQVAAEFVKAAAEIIR